MTKNGKPDPEPDYDHDFEDMDEDEHSCWTCHGEGWGIIGTDFSCDDAINGPYDGDVAKCLNCRGSGLAKDCWYW